MESIGIEALRAKLAKKQTRVNERYRFYEMKNLARDFGIATPPDLIWWTSCVGWCAKAVDTLADRLVFREFRNDSYDMNGIFNLNNPDILSRSAILSALIGSCSFVYIRDGGGSVPLMQVIDGANATGVINPVTGLLDEGYAVLERDERGQVLSEAYFTGDRTWILRGGETESFPNPAGIPLLVPIVFKPDAKRPFGHSRISRACMNLTSSALRTIKRSEIAAEFYSYPQKYATGLSADTEIADKWKASMSAMITFTKDEDGDHPTLGQFSQQSMEPHISQLKMFASLFGGETGLTPEDMGFPADNPSSAEAIKASHESLRLTASAAQKSFGSGLLNVGYVAACLRDEYPYRRDLVYETRPVWEPIFLPDAAALTLIGDGVIKLNQAIPGYITEETMRDITGI